MNKKLILGVTLGGSSRLLDGQAKYFKELGYEVFLISQDHFKEPIFCNKEGIQHLPVKDIVADIHPIKDIKALVQIIRHFRSVKPDIVNVGTPKMGLLGMMAAKLLGIQKRIYTCRGLRYETETGMKRKILMAMEKLTVSLARQVIYVSPSMYQNALKDGVADANKAVIIPPGSSNGVNIDAFNQSKINLVDKKALIEKYQLEDKLVIGFVGRVTLHKGAYELVEAFEKLSQDIPNLRLILMGHIKCDEAFEKRFRAHPGIIHIPFQDDVPLYMSLFDIFVLPSWREGFPNVPIQAAAMGIPVIVSDATGCIDSVQHGVNGSVFRVKDSMALYETLNKYIQDPELREIHGQNGITWAQNFESEKIWNGIQKVYELW
jgi:glycosyltransferase involved in cell wall biosynthesis